MFSNWYKWSERNKIPDLNYPGVYVISKSEKDLHGKTFANLESIIYFGMTNSVNGLKGRLKQFDETIKKDKRNLHGGAERVKFRYKDYDKLVESIYVSVHPFKCDVKSQIAKDLRIMGKVVEFEYICQAEYVERFNKLPEFNDKKRSPKK